MLSASKPGTVVPPPWPSRLEATPTIFAATVEAISHAESFLAVRLRLLGLAGSLVVTGPSVWDNVAAVEMSS
jgi:hypothetical protein